MTIDEMISWLEEAKAQGAPGSTQVTTTFDGICTNPTRRTHLTAEVNADGEWLVDIDAGGGWKDYQDLNGDD